MHNKTQCLDPITQCTFRKQPAAERVGVHTERTAESNLGSRGPQLLHFHLGFLKGKKQTIIAPTAQICHEDAAEDAYRRSAQGQVEKVL